MTGSEWVIVNGHVLGQCAYLNDDDLSEPCDCRDLLEVMLPADDERDDAYNWTEADYGD